VQTRFTAAQLADPDVAASEQILRKCVHCGFCTATCPTYVLLGDELDGPRGRIYLIKEMLEHDRPATAAVVRHIDRCLSCLACMTTCPSGVHYQHLIDHARVHVERTFRRPWADRWLRALLAWILPYPARFRVVLAAAALARPLGPLLPARWRRMLALVPPRRRELTLAHDAAPAETARARGAHRARVAVLTGCVQAVIAPDINAATVRLLERAGADVVAIPGCCGAMVHHLGRDAQARSLAAALIERLRVELAGPGLDAIVANASGCGTQLKDYAYLYRNDAELAVTAADVAARTRDVSELLAELGLPPAARPLGMTVAYHSACSMQHGQKIERPPRDLLARAGFTVLEIPEGHLCCGSAGTYNLLQPELSDRLRDRKLANVARTGAALVATGNIGCIAQLSAAAAVPVVHTVELLDWATGGPAPATIRHANGTGGRSPR
jgi:glycolate oxidase iron-sulfur subunit